MNKDNIKEKTQNMLIGGAIGDALGVPYEFQTKEYIQQHVGFIHDYLPAKNNMFFQKGGYDGDDVGLISDDTLLTFVTIDSIIKQNKIDFSDIMNRSYEALQGFSPGFGRSTTSALEKFQQGVDITLTGSTGAISNGIMMKQSPYAAYFLAQSTPAKQIENTLETITYATHKSPETFVTATTHNFLLMQLLGEETDITAIYEKTLGYALEKEQEVFHHNPDVNFKISDILSDILENPHRDINDILENYGWGDNIWRCGYLKTTVGICYSLFLQNQDMNTLLKAVNIGGDTDTYAAILGNMLGAYRGKFYDTKYEQGLKDKTKLLQSSYIFSEKIFQNT